MTADVFVFTDPERSMIDYLTARLDQPADPKVGVFYPKSSTDAPATPFVAIGWDGTPLVEYPVRQRGTIRWTVWHERNKRTEAKDIGALVQALLLAHPGDAGVWNVIAGVGPSITYDRDTGKTLVTGTVRVSSRSNPV